MKCYHKNAAKCFWKVLLTSGNGIPGRSYWPAFSTHCILYSDRASEDSRIAPKMMNDWINDLNLELYSSCITRKMLPSVAEWSYLQADMEYREQNHHVRKIISGEKIWMDDHECCSEYYVSGMMILSLVSWLSFFPSWRNSNKIPQILFFEPREIILLHFVTVSSVKKIFSHAKRDEIITPEK